VTLDTLLKRCFPAVVLALIAVAAYFQASAAMQLLGATLTRGLSHAAAPAAPAAAVRGASPREKSAEPILARNVLDSITGPLTARPIPLAKPAGQVDFGDPLSAPSCEGMRVAIVTESPDPEASLVALQAPGDPGPELRHVGDDVAGKKIAFIGHNPRRNSPAVWITGDASLCQALLFAEQPAAPPPAPVDSEPAATRQSDSLLPEIASRIKRVSDNEFDVDRAVVDRILENQAELMRRARIVPEQKDGKVVGIRLFGIRPDTLLGTLGFQNGDRLESINGFNVASPEKALEAYARVRTANNLNVKINRRGQSQSIDYRIK